jgi:hypothetical protein
LQRRQDRLLGRRIKQAGFRDTGKTLDSFDLDFNKKMNRQLVYELATARFVEKREEYAFDEPRRDGQAGRCYLWSRCLASSRTAWR